MSRQAIEERCGPAKDNIPIQSHEVNKPSKYPWIIWRVWSREVHGLMKQHLEDNYQYLSNVFIARMFYKYLNYLGQSIDVRGAHIFEVVHTTMLVEEDIAGSGYAKVVVNLKTLRTADFQKSENWSLTACKDLAEVLDDTLHVNDILVIWGGQVHTEQKRIVLNVSIPTEGRPKTYMVIYRHVETSPVKNGHQQYHIPFHSRDVDNSYHVLHEYEDSIVQKICPLIYRTCVEPNKVSSTSKTNNLVKSPSRAIVGAVATNKSKENTVGKSDLAGSSLPSSKSKSASQSSVSQIVHIDLVSLEPDLDEGDIDITSELNVTHLSTSESVKGKSNESNIPRKDKSPSANLRGINGSLPLTRRNIRLHTSQSQDKSKKEVVEDFVCSESNISSEVISPKRNAVTTLEDSLNTSPSPSLLPKSRSNAKQPIGSPVTSPLPTPTKDPLHASNSNNSSELFSQDVVIQLESQIIHNGLESSQNSKKSSPDKALVDPTRPQSQYSTGRLLNELGNESQRLNEDDSSDTWGSFSTKEICPSLDVSAKKLCELTKRKVFHLKCKILKHHADPTENIVLLRVSDGTIPPFPTKILMPVLPFQKSPDPNDKLLATLEVDVMIRNFDKLTNDLSARSEEVLLTYVTIEKDDKNKNLRLFTMDGTRSEIQAVKESQKQELSPKEQSRGQVVRNRTFSASPSTPKRLNDKDKGGFVPSMEKNAHHPNDNVECESDDDIPLILRKKKKDQAQKLSSSTNKALRKNENSQDLLMPSSQETRNLKELSVKLDRLDTSMLSAKGSLKLGNLNLRNSQQSQSSSSSGQKHESKANDKPSKAAKRAKPTQSESSDSLLSRSSRCMSRNPEPQPGPSSSSRGKGLRVQKRKPTYVYPFDIEESSDSESDFEKRKPKESKSKSDSPQLKKKKLDRH